MKQTLRQYSWVVLLVFLTACGKQPIVLPTETSIPTVVSATPVPTSTFIAIIILPSPSLLPTQPTIPVITPDAIQVERWKEYQTELAKLVLAQHSSQEIPFDETALCEWDILGSSGQEVYVWAMCGTIGSGGTKPAVIHLGLDGSIQKVEVPFHGSSWDSKIRELFPANVQEKIYLYSSSNPFSGRPLELQTHLGYRLTHPEELPLIVLSATLTP